MNFPKYLVFVVAAALVTTFALSSTNFAFGQFQDLSCPSCVMVADDKTLQIHKKLTLPILIWADNFRYAYDHNSIITLNGESNLFRDHPTITVSVTNPIGNIVSVNQITADENGDFTIKLNTAGALWKLDGFYIIKAQGVSESQVFKTKVKVVESVSVECSQNELSASGQCIPFSIVGADVTGARLNIDAKSLLVELTTTGDGTITLNIPRSVLDAKTNGDDADFIVMVDGKSAKFDETSTSKSRSLTLMFSHGTQEIEIVGTFVVPEFGTIAMLILVVAIGVIVAISTRKNFAGKLAIQKIN